MKNKKAYIISGVVLIIFLAGISIINNDTQFETRHTKGISRSLFKDSLANEISTVDYYLRSDHLILDNNFEYFITIKEVSGVSNLRGVLMDWVSPGDSIFKDSNDNMFVINKLNGNKIVVYFK